MIFLSRKNALFQAAALLTPLVAAAADPTAATLRAHSGSADLWSVALRGDASVCQVVGHGGDLTKKEKPPREQCALMFALVAPARLDLKAAATQPPHLIDEPDYELKIGKLSAALAFGTPKECEVAADSKLKCVAHELSSAQKLLLQLRAYGKGMFHSR